MMASFLIVNGSFAAVYCEAPSRSQKWVVASIGDDHLNRYRCAPPARFEWPSPSSLGHRIETEEEFGPGPLSVDPCDRGDGDPVIGHVHDADRVAGSAHCSPITALVTSIPLVVRFSPKAARSMVRPVSDSHQLRSSSAYA
jgi:hypothetical protein